MSLNEYSIRGLVDRVAGTISREVFVSEELYQQELDQVFARSWLFVGHESQIPNPNDYFISRMGEESVIMTRDRQGEVHVLLNTCMHRGMKVCRYDEGNTPVFSCPYHGWSYSTDGNLVSIPGELIGVPQFQSAYHGELKKEDWGLVSVPQMHIYKGTIWACWDPDAPDWDTYMGDMKRFIDPVFDASDGREGGRVVVAGVQKWLVPSNWKLAAENFIGDGYHGVTTHRSASVVGKFPARHQQQSGITRDRDRVIVSLPNGHGILSAYPPDLWNEEIDRIPYEDSEVDDYFARAWVERQKRQGGRGAADHSALTVFPNMSAGGGWTSVAVWHPAGPRMTEVWRFFLVDADAPPEVKNVWRSEQIAFSGPTGLVETDDMENWNYASEASAGAIARRYSYNYAQGLGYERSHHLLPGAHLSSQTSEQNARGFYWRWAQMMDASGWEELHRWDTESGI